ncbi:hypothetical protein MLD38_040068 [Melastoma candidum]|uniref:Uncharacterized protein n=1 Tax=Melastoma candidum TaxID=119954 RepID=A0ACB9L5P2_9MYRT|nr:hypothetical protein MLD38_040068 [Melastoma candidum]
MPAIPPGTTGITTPFQRRHVQIYHNVSGGESFVVHCKSKDDDLGQHTFGPGQMYEFKFHSHILGHTLFYCGFSVGDFKGVFDIYDHYRDIYRCPTYCRWYVIETGIIGRRQPDNVADIYFPFT